MAILKKYQDKKIAVYGMGITGRSAARVFKKLKSNVYCWDDDKKIRRKVKKLKFNVEKFWLKKNIDKIVLSPGIDIRKCKINNYLKKNIRKIITAVDVFFECNRNANGCTHKLR